MRKIHTFLLNRDDAVSGRLLINILEKSDPDALVHGVAVAEIALLIARHAGVEKSQLGSLWLAGLFHDIGKLGVPSEILQQKGKLSKGQRRYVEKHPVIGKFLVDRLFKPGPIGEAILSHHECIDGSGYPSGKTSDAIPILGRVLAIADYYDAARSAGWMFQKKSHDVVIAELRNLAGKKFDTELIKTVVKNSAQLNTVHVNVHESSAKELRLLL